MKTFTKLFSILLISLGLNSNVVAQATLTINSVSGTPGSIISVPVMAKNITDMQGLQFTIVYDNTKLEYQSCSDWGGGTKASGVMINSLTGKITFVYNDDPVNITDGKFFDLNFKVKDGASGNTAITWSDNPTARELSNSVPEIIQCSYVNGSVKINGATAQTTLSISSVSGTAGDIVSVPVMAKNITDMQGFQFTIVYDNTKLEYQNCSDWGGGTKASGVMINALTGKITFVYNDDPVNITDGKFFDLNFKVKDDASGNAAITWSDNPTARELSNSVPEIISCNYMDGKVTISNATSLKADFSADITSGPAPLIVHFTDKTTGSPTFWKWDFGDGTNSSDQNPVHTYQNPGTYSVSLIAGNQQSNDTIIKTNYIVVQKGVTTHFKPVWSGNPYQPMNILVKSANIYGISLKKGDEIGVFVKDSHGNEICVGDGQIVAPIENGKPLSITVSADDPSTSKLDGFKNGDTIFYKIWSVSSQLVFSNISSDYDSTYNHVFIPLGTAVVSLSVYGHYHPVWNGNPYQPMNILIDSIILPDSNLKEGDEVGVFDKDESGNSICVGAGVIQGTVSSKSPLTIIASSDDPGTKKIDGFIKGHRIIYKVWSSGSQKEYSNFSAKYKSGLDSRFSPLGTALVYLKYQTSIEQNFALSTGWNIISFYVVPDTLKMLSVLRPLISANHLVKVIDEKGDFIQNIPGVGWMNTIGDMANTEGYYVKVSKNDTFTAKGNPVALPLDVPLQTGWNMMGYPLQKAQSAVQALKQLMDSSILIKVMSQTGGFIQNIPGVGWMNTIGNFNPNEGYYIKVRKNCSLVLDNPITKMAPEAGIPANAVLPKPEYFHKVFSGNPYYPMNIVVTGIDFPGYTQQPGDEIAVFDKGVCVGVGEISGDINKPVNIVASLDDPLTQKKGGYEVGDPISVKYMSSKLKSPVDVTLTTLSGGSLFTPLGTVVCGIAASPDVVKSHLKPQGLALYIYPNPAHGKLSIEINNDAESHVKIEIMDITGKSVLIIDDKTVKKGRLVIHKDLSTLHPGIYFVRVIRQIKDQTSVKNLKLILTR